MAAAFSSGDWGTTEAGVSKGSATGTATGVEAGAARGTEIVGVAGAGLGGVIDRGAAAGAALAEGAAGAVPGRWAKAVKVSGATRKWVMPESCRDSRWWIVPSNSFR